MIASHLRCSCTGITLKVGDILPLKSQKAKDEVIQKNPYLKQAFDGLKLYTILKI